LGWPSFVYLFAFGLVFCRRIFALLLQFCSYIMSKVQLAVQKPAQSQSKPQQFKSPQPPAPQHSEDDDDDDDSFSSDNDAFDSGDDGGIDSDDLSDLWDADDWEAKPTPGPSAPRKPIPLISGGAYSKGAMISPPSRPSVVLPKLDFSSLLPPEDTTVAEVEAIEDDEPQKPPQQQQQQQKAQPQQKQVPQQKPHPQQQQKPQAQQQPAQQAVAKKPSVSLQQKPLSHADLQQAAALHAKKAESGTLDAKSNDDSDFEDLSAVVDSDSDEEFYRNVDQRVAEVNEARKTMGLPQQQTQAAFGGKAQINKLTHMVTKPGAQSVTSQDSPRSGMSNISAFSAGSSHSLADRYAALHKSLSPSTAQNGSGIALSSTNLTKSQSSMIKQVGPSSSDPNQSLSVVPGANAKPAAAGAAAQGMNDDRFCARTCSATENTRRCIIC